LAADGTVNIIGVVDRAGALRAVLVVFMAWFKIFLAFNYLVYTLI